MVDASTRHRILPPERVDRYIKRDSTKLQRHMLRLRHGRFQAPRSASQSHSGAMELVSSPGISISLTADNPLRLLDDSLRLQQIYLSACMETMCVMDSLGRIAYFLMTRWFSFSSRLMGSWNDGDQVTPTLVATLCIQYGHAAQATAAIRELSLYIELLIKYPGAFWMASVCQLAALGFKAHESFHAPILMLFRHISRLADTFFGPRHPLALMFGSWSTAKPADLVHTSLVLARAVPRPQSTDGYRWWTDGNNVW